MLCCHWIVLRATLRKTPSLPPRIQFFALEIAQNGEGHNKVLYTIVQDKEKKKADSGEEKGANGKKKTDNGGSGLNTISGVIVDC